MPSWTLSLEARPFKLLPKEQVHQRVAADCLVGNTRWTNEFTMLQESSAHTTPSETRILIADLSLVTYSFILDTVETLSERSIGRMITKSWMELEDVQIPAEASQSTSGKPSLPIAIQTGRERLLLTSSVYATGLSTGVGLRTTISTRNRSWTV
jgi:hypothetical protein